MNLSLSLGAGGTGGLTVLCEDGERVLCRGWRDDGDGDRKAVLAVLSGSEHPTPGFIDRLAHEYALRDELDGRSAVRPLALVREHGRTVLLLEDPGGEPLDRLLGQPMEIGRFLRFAIGLSAALRQLHERGLIHKDIKPANVLVDVATGQVWLTGFGIASRSAARAPVARTSRGHRRNARLHGARTDRTNEPFDRFPERSLFPRGHLLRNADRRAALHGLRSDGMGPLPHRATAGAAGRAVGRTSRRSVSAIVMKLLAKTAEDRYQTAAGVESDLRRCLAAMGTTAPHRPVPARRARHVGPAADPGETVRTRARDRHLARRLRPCRGRRRAGIGARFRLFRHRQVRPSSTSCTRCWSRRAACFASGKFDQYKRDIPYATLAQAFQSLVRRLLGKSEAELSRWRDRLQRGAWTRTVSSSSISSPNWSS